jgi:hypothetical protein
MDRTKSLWTIGDLMEETRAMGLPLRYGAVYRMVLDLGVTERMGTALVLDRAEHKRWLAMMEERKGDAQRREEKARAEAEASKEAGR